METVHTVTLTPAAADMGPGLPAPRSKPDSTETADSAPREREVASQPLERAEIPGRRKRHQRA